MEQRYTDTQILDWYELRFARGFRQQICTQMAALATIAGPPATSGAQGRSAGNSLPAGTSTKTPTKKKVKRKGRSGVGVQ
jgi:hypothetical protein